MLPYDKEKRDYFGNQRNVLEAQAFVQRKHENYTRKVRRKEEGDIRSRNRKGMGKSSLSGIKEAN